MNGLTLYRTVSIALFVAAGVLAVAAVILFFVLRIWRVIGRLSGAHRVRGDEREMDWTPGSKNYKAPAPSTPDPAVWRQQVQGAQYGAPGAQQRAPYGVQNRAVPYRGPAAPTGTVPLAPQTPGGPAAPTGRVPLAPRTPGGPAAPTGTVPLAPQMPDRSGPDGEGTVQLDEEPTVTGGDSTEAARRKLGFQPDVKVLVFQSDERI